MLISFISKSIPFKNTLSLAALFFAMFCTFSACKKETIITIDPAKQAADDEALIKQYVAKDSTMRQAKRTDSGIYYATLKPGSGPQVQYGNNVKVHYIGRFLNGSKFESSYDKNSPFTLMGVGTGRVIKGWDEGLQLMKEGETMRFYIPSGLAYGPYGNSSIPANAVLVFDINVLDILN